MFLRSPRVCCLALFVTGLLYGQADLATVTGVVTDSAKALIPGVRVTIRNTGTDISHSATTNQEGYFTITELPAGPYELIAISTGFETYRQTEIVLETGQALRADIKLTIGSVNETVSVTAQAATLNTENGMVTGQMITSNEIDNMPLNGRDFNEQALYVPGVSMGISGAAGSFAAINGARQDNTNFVVDGIDDRNVRDGTANFRPPIDSIQEFSMEVGGYSAEYGKMAGGILNMTLKSGTNQYHGTLFEYFRNDFFDAKAYFDVTRLPFHQNQFGGEVAGPVNIPKIYNGHDRTFFMFSWESLRNPYSTTALGTVPTALEDQGNFSKDVSNTGKVITIKNPFSSYAAFPGNIIPTSHVQPDRHEDHGVVSAAQPDRRGTTISKRSARTSTTSIASSPGAITGSTTRTACRCATASASDRPMLPSAEATSASSIPLPTTTEPGRPELSHTSSRRRC